MCKTKATIRGQKDNTPPQSAKPNIQQSLYEFWGFKSNTTKKRKRT